MFQTNLKIAWRNLIKDKQFTFLNLLGLSTGLACSFLIYLWVNDEMSVDKFHEKDKRLYQVLQNVPTSDGVATFEGTPGPLAASLAIDIPEIESTVAVRPGFNKGILSAGEKHLKAREQYAGKDFFELFSYPLIEGASQSVLANKSQVVISDELAWKLFGTKENIIGKTIEWDFADFSGSYIVSGMFKKPGTNSSARFDILFSYDLFLEKRPQFREWGNSNPNTYLLVKDGADIDHLNVKLSRYAQAKSSELKSVLFLRRFSDRYLYGNYENGVQTGGRIVYVRLFSVIAICILIIACINFMNLSTAKASQRLKEVGVKKVVGAQKSTLVVQYLGESVLMSFLSVLIALCISATLLPVFNEITGKELTISLTPRVITSIIVIGTITGLVAGSYPAFYLSSFRPVAVLKGKLTNSLGEHIVRKGLVVFQFGLSVVFIVSVLVIYEQMQLIRNKNIGYNKDNVIYFAKEGRVAQHLAPFLSEVKKLPGIVNAANTGHDFTGGYGFTSGVSWENKNPDTKIDFGNLGVGYNLIETLGYTIKEGRPFSEAFGSDSSAIIFNEAAIDAMGLKDPVGKTVELWGEKRTIVGVVGNFNFESLYENVKPCFLRLDPQADKIVVRIKAGAEQMALEGLRALYKDYTQGLSLDYAFLDDAYASLYATEERVSLLSRYFAGLAIIISCLGLFGLATFIARKRQKEFCIRKIVGASATNIVAILSKEFLKLLLISILIAFPVAWWILDHWLNNFAYRITIGPTQFIITAIFIIVITLTTISFQTIKAAVMNPAKNLRNE